MKGFMMAKKKQKDLSETARMEMLKKIKDTDFFNDHPEDVLVTKIKHKKDCIIIVARCFGYDNMGNPYNEGFELTIKSNGLAEYYATTASVDVKYFTEVIKDKQDVYNAVHGDYCDDEVYISEDIEEDDEIWEDIDNEEFKKLRYK